MFIAFFIIHLQAKFDVLFGAELRVFELSIDAHNLCSTPSTIFLRLEQVVSVEELFIVQRDDLARLVT